MKLISQSPLRKVARSHIYMLFMLLPLLTVAGGLAFAQEQSYIQIKCEADVKVFLDGEYKGKTQQEQQGLLLQNIAPGRHLISFQKDGFEEVRIDLYLKPGEVKVVEPAAFNRRSGLLVVQSLPVNITISLQSSNKSFEKEEDLWSSDLPEGKYTAIFANGSQTLRTDFIIKYNMATGLFVNFLASGINTNIYPCLEGQYQVVGSGKLLGTISDVDISFEPIATGLRGRITGPDSVLSDNTFRLSYSMQSIKVGEKALDIVWRVLIAGQIDGGPWEKSLDCLISGKIEQSLSEIPVVLKMQHPVYSNRTVDAEGKLVKLTERTTEARKREEETMREEISARLRNIAGSWNMEIMNQQYSGGVRSSGLSISQSGKSITFQTRHELDNTYNSEITWRGTYEQGHLRAESSVQYVTEHTDYGRRRFDISFTLEGEMEPSSGLIRGIIRSKERDSDWPDDVDEDEQWFVIKPNK